MSPSVTTERSINRSIDQAVFVLGDFNSCDTTSLLPDVHQSVQPATEVDDSCLNPNCVMKYYFAKGLDGEGKSYTHILVPSVLCNSMDQAASYWFFVPHFPNTSVIGGHDPLTPSDYATAILLPDTVGTKNH